MVCFFQEHCHPTHGKVSIPSDGDNFILCGGNSLQAVNLYEAIHQIFLHGKEIPELLDLILSKSFTEIVEFLLKNIGLVDASMASSQTLPAASEEGICKSVSRCSNVIELFPSHLTEPPVPHPSEGASASTQSGNSEPCEGTLIMDRLWSYSTGKCVDASPLVVLKK